MTATLSVGLLFEPVMMSGQEATGSLFLAVACAKQRGQYNQRPQFLIVPEP